MTLDGRTHGGAHFTPDGGVNDGNSRSSYREAMEAIGWGFERGATSEATVRARSDAVDSLVASVWRRQMASESGVAVVAVGGFGRRELFPQSDVDLLFLLDELDEGRSEEEVRDALRRVNQELWDCGVRVSPMTRRLSECARFESDNVEFTLALLDARGLAGDEAVHLELSGRVLPDLLRREAAAIGRRLAQVTALRHTKYGETLFHLEPNIKECPGGLRDVHVCRWARQLSIAMPSGTNLAAAEDREFAEAASFMAWLRCFLHLRRGRDDNTLDWEAQEEAAALARTQDDGADVASWMRAYFRQARIVARRAIQTLETLGERRARSDHSSPLASGASGRGRVSQKTDRRVKKRAGFRVEDGTVVLDASETAGRVGPEDVARDPDVVLAVFEAVAQWGFRLGRDAEMRMAQALPYLAAELEEGPALWRHLAAVLTGRHAGLALRAMHAIGILELMIPEFHGIDALVVRDAYHRYTVDEHTFVLIDRLHALERDRVDAADGALKPDAMAEWTARFRQLLRDLQQPALLYLVALLHDTGKGRSADDHAHESSRLARSVLERLELDSYESNQVLQLIAGHLEMSAALRRDIFDPDTVRGFVAKVQTHESLRMLALFTYADIQAVHPDALTAWKAENIWRLYVAASNDLDRSVDEQRLKGSLENELIHRVAAALPGRRAQIEHFLDGLPERYLLTRSAEQVRSDYECASRFQDDPVQLQFRYSPQVNEMTLVTRDRPQLFAAMAGALAAWGMNIVTAEGFSNCHGVVVDTFRFTDGFRTLEMNTSERQRFVEYVHDVVSGSEPVDRLLHGRRRRVRRTPMVKVTTRVDFDDAASSHCTLMQVAAQDTPGLLHALSLTLAQHGCNIEVAVIDTEGELAIDVFYLTIDGNKLDAEEKDALRQAMIEAIEAHVQ